MSGRPSAFAEIGFSETVQILKDEIKELYQADTIPWVIGYSGGKDSTSVLELVWLALSELQPERRHKTVHVISTDTLVENPVVAAWVTNSLVTMERAASAQGIPIKPHRLTPEVVDTFWVNLIGKGYPAPRNKFRWCTERLKIKPANKFILSMVRESGEVILVLGTRKAESAKRSHVMSRLEKERIRERLSPNESLPNSLIYSPIESWSNDDVWVFLMQIANPWGYANKDLLSMYRGASPDSECPLVVDTSTPSCGDSRFGCWVCTMVEQDRSMQTMIQNDEEKAWMQPLLELRNELDVLNDRHLRDFRRRSGIVQIFHDEPVHGPYTQEARATWLRKLLAIQKWLRENGPDHMKAIELVTLKELEEIRRIWVVEKHEFEDLVPRIHEEATGEPYPSPSLERGQALGAEELRLLQEICGEDRLHYELVRELLHIEKQRSHMTKRAGLFGALLGSLRKGAYSNKEEAIELARQKKKASEETESVRREIFEEPGVYEIKPKGTKKLTPVTEPILSGLEAADGGGSVEEEVP